MANSDQNTQITNNRDPILASRFAGKCTILLYFCILYIAYYTLYTILYFYVSSILVCYEILLKVVFFTFFFKVNLISLVHFRKR